MSAKILGSQPSSDGGETYDAEYGAVKIVVAFYRGEPEAGEQPWRADIRFEREESDLDGQGSNCRAAFLAAASRHSDAVSRGIPLPAVHWSDVEEALEEAGAFRKR